MDKKYVEEKIKKEKARREEIIKKIKKAVEETEHLGEAKRQEILKKIENKDYYLVNMDIRLGIILYNVENKTEDASILEKELEYFNGLGLDEMSSWREYDFDAIMERLCDSEPKFFSGDIIITDPCYILKHGERDDWSLCDCGYEMEELGIQNYMTRSTNYGDWSCTTYNSDTKEPIGEFCADAGLVSVFLLDEVLKYNPGFDYHIQRKWTTTLIKDFEGMVQFTVTEEPYEYEGSKYVEYVVRVVGHGKNKVTGEPINFITEQTGL